jgi:hypothetical protein
VAAGTYSADFSGNLDSARQRFEYEETAVGGNYKSQNPNNKWFDKPFDRLTVLSKVGGLTTPSQVEGQITMTNPPPADQTCFGHLIPALWNAASWRPSSGGFHRVKILDFFVI